MLCRWTLFLFVFLLSSLVWTTAAKPLTFYVATNGNDAWSGGLAAAARDGRDGPLATLPAALKAARLARQSSNQTPEPVSIFLRAGTYPITRPIVLGPEDSGSSADQPFTVAAY